MDTVLAAAHVLQRTWFMHIPDAVLSVPHAPSIMRFWFFFIFAEALGLLWGFMIIVLQALSRRFVEWVVLEVHRGESYTFWSAASFVGRCYVMFSIFRMLFLLAGGVWTFAWEAAADFPTVREMFVGRHYGGNGSKRFLKRVLVVPIAIITFSFLVAAAVPAVCADGGQCGTLWLTDQLAHADGRGNRMLRWSLVIMMIQWVQLFVSLSPTGIVGLCTTAPLGRKLALVVLVLTTYARLTQFVWRPSDHIFFGNVHTAILRVSRHMNDNALFILWGMWLTLAIARTSEDAESLDFGSDAAQPLSLSARSVSTPDMQDRRWRADANQGKVRAPNDSECWETVSLRVQYTLVIAVVGYWGRSCLSPQIGWNFAQLDLMALLTIYPLLSVVIWSATYAAVALRNARPRWAVMACLCVAIAAVLAYPGVPMAFASLHLLRQASKLLGTRRTHYVVRDTSCEARAERRWAYGLAYCFTVVLVVFFIGLSCLALAAAAQQHLGLFVGKMEFAPSNDNSSIYIGHHAIIRNNLKLSRSGTSLPLTQTTGAYGICEQRWNGLSALDYALFSLAAYWDVDDPQLAKVLAHLFPVEAGLNIAVVNGSRTSVQGDGGGMPWLELEVIERGTRVIAVRGTDPTNVGHVVEDIRLWTEPVVLALLSFTNPLIRIWSGQTVDEWVSTNHAFLGVFELDTGPWAYEPLVQHLQNVTHAAQPAPWITGHSLGGGIAQIVAALTGSSAFAISPPGLLQSFMKHWWRAGERTPGNNSSSSSGSGSQSLARSNVGSLGVPGDKSVGIPHSSAHMRSVSVVVEGDWVSQFDNQPGFVQTVTCNRDDLAIFGGCHLLESTICQLVQACGDPRGRWQHCEHEFEPLVEGMQMASELPHRVLQWARHCAALPGIGCFGGIPFWKGILAVLCAATALQLVVAEVSLGLLRSIMATCMSRCGFCPQRHVASHGFVTNHKKATLTQ